MLDIYCYSHHRSCTLGTQGSRLSTANKTQKNTKNRTTNVGTLLVPAFLFLFLFFAYFYFPAFGQAVVTGVVPSPPRFLPSIFIAHRAQQSHCSSMFHRVLLTHALALSASQFVRKKKSPRIYTSITRGDSNSRN